MSAAQLSGVWDDVANIVDSSDARVRQKLLLDVDRVIEVVQDTSGHCLDLEQACADYVRKAGPFPNLDQERDAIVLHIVCTWLFVLTEGWGIVCRTICWEDLPWWVQDWYEEANACDLAWLRQRND